ncbi:unnamed protein product [Spirodela intermedia]|uniref:non-specific serine/threonine protein kinase n=1 Tax=Spirodela intermedia TaxID=51605 RepID=A0A7I8INH2_SPIIN|nr:unnamed protein product [Spirodela intermedia]CAA6659406.1 unnamed protein product [Spirodela intermedia]
MKNILKKLHIVPNESDGIPKPDLDGSSSSKGGGSRRSRTASPSRRNFQLLSDQKPLSGLSNWLSSVTNRHGGSSTSPPVNMDTTSSSCSPSPLDISRDRERLGDGSPSYHFPGSDFVQEVPAGCSLMNESGAMDVEAYQIQLALELSAKEDPEAVQIEAVKQISLGSCPAENTPAEIVAYRYWNYNVLSYDDKILDGFYDLYGIFPKIPDSDAISWEAILVNRASDTDLSNLENRALVLAVESRSVSKDYEDVDLVRSLAIMVAEYMGGAVRDPEVISNEWRDLSNRLRESFGNMVLPLGHLTVGLARHRALMFKVLADSVGVPCQLLKGQLYTGSDDGAVNIVKINNGREYIVDLMADPGTLIPTDAGVPQRDGDIATSSVSSSLKDLENSHASSFSTPSSVGCFSQNEMLDRRSSITSENERGCMVAMSEGKQILKSSYDNSSIQCLIDDRSKICEDSSDSSSNQRVPTRKASPRLSQAYSLGRSPSWTEGISSPAVRRMKAKDVSQYMIDAAKENPQLAQKLHDVLLESGVVAPLNLFTEIIHEQPDCVVSDDVNLSDKQEIAKRKDGTRQKCQADPSNGQLNLPTNGVQPKVYSRSQVDHLEPVAGLGVSRPLNFGVVSSSPQSETPVELQTSPVMFIKNMPVAAAAAATAAVVASSMVVAAAKSNSDKNLEVPVAAAATATAAVVAATTAAVSKQYEPSELVCSSPTVFPTDVGQKFCEEDGTSDEHPVIKQEYNVSPDSVHHTTEGYQETERSSDKSTGYESTKSDVALDDVAEFEILWEDLTLGERIGLGSYGEVFHGELHGTEVAIKKFLQQDISGDALEEFRSEVQIMKRLRHPNVVLFMGAVTRVPNLSIITEFLPRGSLFRLIHRPNNQLDERRRLRMALDVARGMNYLHNGTPTIVHGDLKSPNLLVDKNWVVKVCDFGLSRMKHSTFLSSRSMAGTAEWMAPEVLRNEPSDEKPVDAVSGAMFTASGHTVGALHPTTALGGMNPMQVVGAVGFQQRQLDIPGDVDPAVADIIMKCWQTEPKLRPSFSEIMAALKPLQKALAGGQTLLRRHQQRAPPRGPPV